MNVMIYKANSRTFVSDGWRGAGRWAVGWLVSCSWSNLLMFFVFVFLVSSRLMVLKLDPNILLPIPHSLGAKEANMLGEAAAEAPHHTSSCSSLPSHPSLYVSTELSRPINSLLNSLSLSFTLSFPPTTAFNIFSFSHLSPLSFIFSLSLRSSTMYFLNLLILPEIPLPTTQPDFLQPKDNSQLHLQI